MQAALILHTYRTVTCPHCNKDSGSRIDHLLPPNESAVCAFGPWYCGECGKPFQGATNPKFNAVEVVKSDSRLDVKVPTLDLMVLPPQKHPVYFVLRGSDYRPEGMGSMHPHPNKPYFYDEHSCPTNWLRNVDRVIIESDDDPHGLIQFVRSVDVADVKHLVRSQDMDGEDVNPFKAFPELHQFDPDNDANDDTFALKP